ncbi:IS91 family transposase [Thioalkalivibrio thiocyanodenitrificans]|uniref:IS91 family transposase n=1 Tax=Thioalkalivibrio thiocyanodenitrificans TaxID=243063 RepID=UPI00037E6DAF|nr:IS91 family transposase [Thioalkalivibrio thiocyanodenitrificans]
MAEPATVQQALARFLDASGLDGQRRKVCAHLQACRTEAMGGMRLQCAQCRDEQIVYHGCRDRHCPQCQGRATRQWAERQRGQILAVPYYHLVFTLPHELNGWVALHPRVIYRLLFEAVWATLKAFGEDPRRLGGELGMSAVLHTWGQNMSRHVHLHCLVPGGALRDDGQWQASRGNYLFPVRALSRRFRGRMVAGLRQAASRGELGRVTREGEIDALLERLMAHEWVVYTKHCLQHTATVVDYLARYTHRIAITNARILAVDDRQVTLRYKDSRDGDRHKTLCLEGAEFVRRFLMHVLPKGLMRIRHFGFLANRGRREKLERIRRALAMPPPQATVQSGTPDHGEAGYPCAKCRQGRLHVIAQLAPRHRPWRPPEGPS